MALSFPQLGKMDPARGTRWYLHRAFRKKDNENNGHFFLQFCGRNTFCLRSIADFFGDFLIRGWFLNIFKAGSFHLFARKMLLEVPKGRGFGFSFAGPLGGIGGERRICGYSLIILKLLHEVFMDDQRRKR